MRQDEAIQNKIKSCGCRIVAVDALYSGMWGKVLVVAELSDTNKDQSCQAMG